MADDNNAILESLKKRSDDFKLTIGEATYDKEILAREISADSEIGRKAKTAIGEQDKETAGIAKATEVLSSQPENFKWLINEVLYDKIALLEALQEKYKLGRDVWISVMDYYSAYGDGPNQLGKRIRCLVCRTECLCVKAGDGTASCCGQSMWQIVPRPLPGSD